MPTEDISAVEPDGSRPAAARRPLLSRLRMPVGKAIALAAMPSAALLGMGFTSPLAKADPQPENPFADGPCVTQPDEEPVEEPAEDRATEDRATEEAPAEEPPPEDPAEPEEPADDLAAEEPPAAEEPAEPAEPAEEPTAGRPAEPAEEAPAAPPTPEEPAEEDEFNPWDPLGLGRGLEELWDLLTPGERAEAEEAQRAAEEQAAAEAAAEEEARAAEAAAAEAEAERERRAAAEERAAEEAAEAEAEAETETSETESGETTEPETETETGTGTTESDQSTESSEPETEPGTGSADEEAPTDGAVDGREPFPCPEELRVPGEDEQTALVLPDAAWYLDATYLTLRGLDYHGVVNVTTANGSVKQVLKFTAEKLDIGDLHQIVDAADGVRYHVATAPGSNSTFRDGTVTMYTERLEGNLFGVIPVVFDAEHQPPLDLPIAHFTDVFVTQAGQFGGTLTMTGMHSYTTGDGPTVP